MTKTSRQVRAELGLSLQNAEAEITLWQWYMFALRRDNMLNPAEGKAWAAVFCEDRRV